MPDRRFVAVVPAGLPDNAELIQLLNKLKRTTRDREVEVRWVAPDLWHITLAFLGEAQGDIECALKEWSPNVESVNLRLGGLGAFPSNDEARVLWIGVGANQEFLDLQASLTTHLRAAGFPLLEREFNPHLTLARFRNPYGAAGLLGLGGRKHFGDYKIGELVLFESVLQGNIIKYSPKFRRPLNALVGR